MAALLQDWRSRAPHIISYTAMVAQAAAEAEAEAAVEQAGGGKPPARCAVQSGVHGNARNGGGWAELRHMPRLELTEAS